VTLPDPARETPTGQDAKARQGRQSPDPDLDPATPCLSVVIPAFNEEQRLGPTVLQLARFLDRRAGRWEILVVDDGSTDGTAALCRELAGRVPLRLIATHPNRGKGHAVRVGMLAAQGAVRVLCDADGSTPAHQLPRLLDPIQGGRAAVAIGSRYVAGASPSRQPWWRRAWSRLCNLVVQAVLVPGVRDTQCGFKAFSADAARELFARATVDGWAFDVEVLALARQLGFAIVEVGVQWTDDGRSRVRPLRDAWAVIGEAAAIRRRLPAAAPRGTMVR
jgi:dolichyl-phosphate beta-glucosyltransferase